MHPQEPRHFRLRAQPVRLNVPLEPLLGNVLERLGLAPRRLERGEPVTDPANRFPRAFAGIGDRQQVGRAERCPNLLAMRVERDSDERLCARWLNADVEAALFGVGMAVAGGPRLESSTPLSVRVFRISG